MKNLVKQYFRAWEKFWLGAVGEPQMRALRLLLGIHLLIAYGIRALDWKFLYSRAGVAEWQNMREILPMSYRFSLFEWFPSDIALLTGTGVFLGLLVLWCMGKRNVWIDAGVFVLHVSFLHHNLMVAYGMDLIVTFFLFYVLLSNFKARDLNIGSVAFRFAQIQVCVIYAYSGWEKLKGVAWWRGEALWTVLANPQIARFDFGWTAHLPMFIIFSTYVTVLWEIYFCALIWVPKLRRLTLFVGVLVHVGIGVTLFIPHFASLMILTYVVFLTPTELDFLQKKFKMLLQLPKRSLSKP